MYGLRLEPSSGTDSAGQIIALVVAGATVCRAYYILLLHGVTGFRAVWFGKDEGHVDLRLDLLAPKKRLRSSKPKKMPLLAVPFRVSPHEMSPGTLLRNPYDLDSKYQALVKVPPPDLRKSISKPKLLTVKDVGVVAFLKLTTLR